jgi:hypothetical protein
MLATFPAPRSQHKEPAVVLFVYVDNSTLWIERMRISAVRKGLVRRQGRHDASRHRSSLVLPLFPDRDSLIRLVGAVLAEQHDE